MGYWAKSACTTTTTTTTTRTPSPPTPQCLHRHRHHASASTATHAKQQVTAMNGVTCQIVHVQIKFTEVEATGPSLHAQQRQQQRQQERQRIRLMLPGLRGRHGLCWLADEVCWRKRPMVHAGEYRGGGGMH